MASATIRDLLQALLDAQTPAANAHARVASKARRPSKFEDKVIVDVDARGVGLNAAHAYVAAEDAIDPDGLLAEFAAAKKARLARKKAAAPVRKARTTTRTAEYSLEDLVSLFEDSYPEALTALRVMWKAKSRESSAREFVHLLMGYSK